MPILENYYRLFSILLLKSFHHNKALIHEGENMLVAQSCPNLCDPMDCSLPGSCLWNSPGKNSGVDSHSFLQGIFLTQGSNPSLLHGRKILYCHLRYVDNTTLMEESGEELKSLWMRVKEKSEKAGFKLNITKTKITTSGPTTSWQ